MVLHRALDLLSTADHSKRSNFISSKPHRAAMALEAIDCVKGQIRWDGNAPVRPS